MEKVSALQGAFNSASTKRPCPACGNSSRASCQEVYHIPEFDVLRCRQCHATFIDRVVDDNEGFTVNYTVSTDALASRKGVDDFLKIKAKLPSLGYPAPKGLRLLDVGCGGGSFLLAPQEEGWQVAGLELSQEVAAWARANRKVRVEVGSIEKKTNFPSDSFDIVTLFGVIEHLAQPREAIRECARILRSGGILVLQTPTEDGLMRRLGRFMFRASGGRIHFQVRQFYTMGGGHSVCFDRRSIETLLERCGFETSCVAQSTYGLSILMERFVSYGPLRRTAMSIGTAIVFSLGKAFGLSNHMTVYARKKPSAEASQ